MTQHDWDKCFIEIARKTSECSGCLRHHVGAIAVRYNQILATGYNTSTCNVLSCKERNTCLRDNLKIKSGQELQTCFAIHAEQALLANAAKQGVSVDGATLYCTLQPCSICAKMIINAGITRVVYTEDYPDVFAISLFQAANIELVKFEE